MVVAGQPCRRTVCTPPPPQHTAHLFLLKILVMASDEVDIVAFLVLEGI